MRDTTAVETADRASRARVFLWAGLSVIFLSLQLFASPWFGSPSAHEAKSWSWLILASLILANLATGGGLRLGRSVRPLLNDEMAQSHRRTALAVGFWAAIAAALGLYVFGAGMRMQAALYLVVTWSLSASLAAFAYLELRAHRDG